MLGAFGEIVLILPQVEHIDRRELAAQEIRCVEMRDARRTSCLVIQLGRSEALQNE